MNVETLMSVLPSHHDKTTLIIKVGEGRDTKGEYETFAKLRGLAYHPTHGAFLQLVPEREEFRIYKGI